MLLVFAIMIAFGWCKGWQGLGQVNKLGPEIYPNTNLTRILIIRIAMLLLIAIIIAWVAESGLGRVNKLGSEIPPNTNLTRNFNHSEYGTQPKPAPTLPDPTRNNNFL